MTDFEKAKPKIVRRLVHQSALGGKTHFYTMIPDPLNQQYIDGKVNDTLFRLIYTLLAQSTEFWITRNWLEDRFSPSTLKKYLPLIIKANIVEVEQVAVNAGGKLANVYHTRHPSDWDMSVICEVPRAGQCCDTSQVKDSEKANDSVDTSQVKDSQVKDSQLNDSEVKDILNTNLTQTNLTQSHTQPEDPVKITYQKASEQLAEKLRNDHAIVTDPQLLCQYMGLIQQTDRAKDLGWILAKYPEWSLYLKAQRNPTKDPSLTLFNWAKGYREPTPAQGRSKQAPQKQKTVLTDEFITTNPEDIWND